MIIRVKYLEANDLAGKFRYATPDALAVGQFDHANSLIEIEEKIRDSIVILFENWEDEDCSETKPVNIVLRRTRRQRTMR